MDKNTVIGMLLMCAVIFGFMYLQPKEDKTNNKQQANTTQTATDPAASASVDTLTAQEMILLDTLTAKNGTIAFEGVTLNNDNGKAAGTVKVDNKTIDLSALTVARLRRSAPISLARTRR